MLLWIGVAAAVVVAAPLELFVIGRVTGYVRHMYMPAESMEPTFKPGDRFIVWTKAPEAVRRGDVVVVEADGGAWYVKRVAAVAGDRVAMRGGQVVLNGRPVGLQRLGRERSTSGQLVELLSERFPGETAPHRIYDSGTAEFDEMDEQIVAPGHLFLLGDNRDRSADSRVPRALMGLEQVPIADVRGTPWLFTWTAEGGKWGGRAGH